MEIWHYALIGGVAGSVGVLISQRRAKKDAVNVLPVLREKGPLTIPQLQEAMNLPGFMKRGKLVMAVGELVKTRQVIEHEVPPGTPQLEKINVRTYSAK
jgi:hypothetical protein